MNDRKPVIVTLLAVALYVLAACGQMAAPPQTALPAAAPTRVPRIVPTLVLSGEPLTKRIDTFLTTLTDNHQFSGYVVVTQGDQTIFSKGYDYSNRETNTEHTLTTRYRIGSVSKQFTAAAILLLESEGKLKVEDLACTHLPNCPPAWKAITIHQLLTHTSGIPNYTDIPGFAKLQATKVTPDELIARFANKQLETVPAGKRKYSNSGYVVLARIVELVSGVDYGTFLGQHFFEPLGMQNTAVDLNPPSLAIGYLNSAAIADPVDTSEFFGAGSISSTAEDLLKWTRALHAGNVVPAAQLTKMITPHLSGETWNPGYGLFIGKVVGHTNIAHGGEINGFRTDVDYFIDDDLIIVIMANQENADPGTLADSLAGFMFRKN